MTRLAILAAAAVIGTLCGLVLMMPAQAAAPGDRYLACDRYAGDVQAAVDRWWTDRPDWREWQAQLFQESRCNPTARSPVGAEGLAQFMPATWVGIMKQLGEDPRTVPRTQARMAIRAGAAYMRQLRDQWRRWTGLGLDAVDDVQRHAQAGYNAGSGNVLKAWRRCGEPTRWARTRECMAAVTGRHAAETLGYVDAIARWRAELGRRR